MLQLSPVFYASILGLAEYSSAQQFPPPASYDTVLKSPINPSITIAYKKPEPGTCTTAFSTQKQYSGYVNIPPFTLAPYQQAYQINTFFWFFEARSNSDTAPLTIWLNGGPGSSSMIGLFQEMGPCEIVQLEDGSYGTQPNLWGWDRSSNLLFIDQPTQVGFSYDQPVNVSQELVSGLVVEPPMSVPKELPSWSLLNATLASGRMNHVENSTIIAARSVWHFLQGFLSAFPQYNPGQRPNQTTIEPAGINLFAESYGGQYGPVFADFFEDQNDRRRAGLISANSTLEIKLDSLGIINGLVDIAIQTPAMASFVYNNTYGLQGMSQTQYLNILSDFRKPDGCLERASKCHARVTAGNCEGELFDQETINLCALASDSCWRVQSVALQLSDKNPYDIRAKSPSSFPSYAHVEYLNQANVLRSIGAKVNFTDSTDMVNAVFHQTGDDVRGTQIKKLVDLLARGVRVALIYGDADIICNWVGGEAASLAVAHESPYSSAFPAAGYADIVTNDSYVGGHVRQSGNLSFSRIFDAGHMVPSYQAETAFVVFSRIISGDDIGMGRGVDLSTFSTQGPAESLHKNNVPPQPENTCWIRAIDETCSEYEKTQIRRGMGVVEHGKWFPQAPDRAQSRADAFNTKAGGLENIVREDRPTTTSRIAWTGVFTAIRTPTPTSGASRVMFRRQPKHRRQLSPGPAPFGLTRIGTAVSNAKNGLIGGIAAVGGLLLLLTGLASCCLCWRRHRSQEHDRKFMGGPRRTPSPPVVAEPALPGPEQAEPKRNIVQRFAQRHRKEPKPSPTRYDIERPEEPPVLDRRPSRRLSAPMEPIPEAQSPRPSADKPQRRVSEHPNEPIFVKEETPTSFVQRNARSPRPEPGEEHPKTPEPSSEPVLSRQPSSQTEKPESPRPEPEQEKPRTPTPEPEIKTSTPVQRTASLQSEDKTLEAASPTEPAPTSEPDTSPNNKPSLLKRIRSGIHHDNEAFKAKAHTLF
ncbi:hypothetical protein DPSP01_010448 [Paraphaeosphaeria sporulosa]